MIARSARTGHRRGMMALYLLIGVDSISSNVIIPLLDPLLIDSSTRVFLLHSSPPVGNLVSGALVAIYVFLMMYMAPMLGRLSDQWGRRPMLMLCGAGVLVGNLLAGLAIGLHSLALLILSRVIGGATAAAQPTAQAALVDTGNNKSRLLSYSILFSSLGFVLGPAVASGLARISFAAPLYLCALLTLIALVLLTSYRDGAKPGRQVDRSTFSIWDGVCCFRDAARDKAVRAILGCFILMQVAWGSFFVFIPVYLMQEPGLRMSLAQLGTLMSIMGIGFCVSNALLQPALAERFGLRTLAVTGLALNAATMVLCVLLGSAYEQYIAALLAGITINIGYPSIVTMLSNRVAAERQGWLMGLVGSSAAMGWGISSTISGALGGLEHALPVLLATALMAGAALGMTTAGTGWRSEQA